MTKAHLGHITRYSDSSFYDEVCILCGYTDSGNALSISCSVGHPYADTHDYDFKRSEKGGYDIRCKTCDASNHAQFHHTCEEIIAAKTPAPEPVRHTPRMTGWTDYPLGDPRNGNVQENCANWRASRAPLDIDAPGPDVPKGHTTLACEKIIKRLLDRLLSLNVFSGQDILAVVKQETRAEGGYIHAMQDNGSFLGVPFTETQIVQTIDTWVSGRSLRTPVATGTLEVAWKEVETTDEPYVVDEILSSIPFVEINAKMEDSSSSYTSSTVEVRTPYGTVYGPSEALDYVAELVRDDTTMKEVGPQLQVTQKGFLSDLTTLINAYSLENGSDTADFILAEYLTGCLTAFDRAVNERSRLRGEPEGGDPSSTRLMPVSALHDYTDVETHH